MKALITLVVILNFLSWASWAGEIPLVLPEKKGLSGERVPASASKKNEKKNKKAKKTGQVGKKKSASSRKTAKSGSGKKRSAHNQKPSAHGKKSPARVKRATASTGDRARVEAYFKKETLDSEAGVSPSKAVLPPRTKVGIKHSVRDE